MMRLSGIHAVMDTLSQHKSTAIWAGSFDLRYQDGNWLTRRLSLRRRLKHIERELKCRKLMYSLHADHDGVTILVNGRVSEVQILLHRLEGQQ